MADLDLDAISEDVFPGPAILLVAARMEMLGDNLTVVKRPLRTNDPSLSIGVYATSWAPTPNSMEMMGVEHAHSSTLEQYSLTIESFVKDAEEQHGLATHSALNELVRTTLGSDLALRASLGGLQATLNGTTKELQRFWVRSSRYLNSKLGGAFLYLATNELMLEVQKIHG